MKKSIFKTGAFSVISVKKENLTCEFILNDGFDFGVKKSQAYHFHSTYEVHIAITGKLHIFIDDRDCFLEQGSICVIPPNSFHYVFADENAKRISFRFNFFSDSLLLSEPLMRFQGFFKSINKCFVTKNTDIYERYVSGAINALLISRPDYMIADPLFLALSELAFSAPEKILVNETENSEPCSSLMFEKIDAFFNLNYDRAVTVNDLSEYLSFSNRHTERIMKKLFSMSFSEMLNKKRLVTASLLIRITDEPLNKIAERCGYSDYVYFSKKFKSLFGFSPREYRLFN